MDIEEARKLVLQRLYEEGFKDYAAHKLIDLKALATEHGIDRDRMVRLDGELYRDHFFSIHAMGMMVSPSIYAIIYCEEHGLVDRDFVDKQRDIRKRILEACADYEEEKPDALGVWGEEICKRAGISSLDFNNNIELLAYIQEVEQIGPFDEWKISPEGRSRVKLLRRRRKRLTEFTKLKEGTDISPQERGHCIEDLLAEVIADEGWNASTGDRPKGMEYDIVFSRDLNYFLISSKWVKEPVQGDVVRDLITQAHDAGYYAGLLVSMSGFTDNCIVLTKERRTNQKVLLFGPGDVEELFSHAEEIFSDKQLFSDLLNEKIQKLVRQSKILVDGIEH